MRGVSGSHQVVSDIINVGSLVVDGAGQGLENEAPMLDGLVAGLQVGREEGGRLATVAEQQQLAALPGLISLHLAVGGRKRLIKSGGDH